MVYTNRLGILPDDSPGRSDTPAQSGNVNRQHVKRRASIVDIGTGNVETYDLEDDFGIIVLDSTRVNEFQKCEKLFEIKHIAHLRPNAPTPPALVYGTAWHALLAAHYATGGDRVAAIEAAERSWTDHKRAEDHRTMPRLVQAYLDYIAKWGMPEEEDGQTMGLDIGEPMVERSVVAMIPGIERPYAGKLDRFFTKDNRDLIYMDDHKTSSRMGPSYFNEYNRSFQMHGYTLLGSALIGKPIAGIRINAHGILKSENRFGRQTFKYNKIQLDQWKLDYERWCERIEAAKKSGVYMRNWHACYGDRYGACILAEICTEDDDMQEQIFENDFKYEPWDPLKTDVVEHD